MNLELYKTFYYVAKYGSFSRASEYMYITQPAVSRAIKQLEEDMKCILFVRTPRGVKLTQEGEILYQYIDQAFNFISAAEKKIEDIQNLQSGEIRIGVSDTLCKHYLLPHLKHFNTLYPSVKIRVTCPTTPGIVNYLKAGKIDFGIINMPYNDEQLNFKSTMEIQDCFIAGEKYKEFSSKIQPLSEIVKHPIILLDKSSNSRIYIDRYFEANSISVTPDFELGNIDLLIHFAKFEIVSCQVV